MKTFIIFLITVPILGFLLLVINIFFSRYKPDKAKVMPFECGFKGLTQTRKPMKFVHTLVAVLFLLFDLELILIAPYALNVQTLGNSGLCIFVIFTIILGIGFGYEYYTDAINIIKKKCHN